MSISISLFTYICLATNLSISIYVFVYLLLKTRLKRRPKAALNNAGIEDVNQFKGNSFFQPFLLTKFEGGNKLE